MSLCHAELLDLLPFCAGMAEHVLDCSLFANKVLPFVRPGAIIMGGDLVDAKTLYMQGHQYRHEWVVSFTLPQRAGANVQKDTVAFLMKQTSMHWVDLPMLVQMPGRL